ncbi:MAG TPA: sialate O-acetylesterase [Lentisphaeria bacterium]|nr:MAG: hypothetical protein A2X48_13620 [Lentisphaerae bacterium GWF2_49_21]HBC89696.1 sialate O-acetylesterase [Lentisphaeria bacterium]
MKMRMKRLLFAAAMVMAICSYADVKVSNLFSDNLVLQRDVPVPVWGTADAGEKVTVKIGETEASAVADEKGKWMVKLPAMKMNSVPQEMMIAGKNPITLKNVLIGDVWICSGQSNMEMALGGCNAKEDVDSANFPNIRRIKFDHRTAYQPENDVPRKWDVCTPQSAPGFTAVGFYFARKVQKETGVPIGLIDNNWGGTRIEPWIAPCGFEMEKSLLGMSDELKKVEQSYRADLAKSLDSFEKWIPEARKALASNTAVPAQPPMPGNPKSSSPSAIYNGQICPIVPFAIKGALWYQGESNGGEGDEYYAKTRALIGGWRKIFEVGDFPFYFVQLANFQQPNDNPQGGDGWARLRMAQLKSLQIPNTGMAVAIELADANNPGDIHPKNKFDVGERLALWALAKDYGKKDLVYSGPLYKSMKVEDNKIRLEFDSVGSGLMVGKKEGRKPTVEDKDGKLKRFAIAGEDKKWVWADAVIEPSTSSGQAANTVVVSSPEVPKPVAVRYAFTMNPAGCNLYNKEGLPASPFRTDDW